MEQYLILNKDMDNFVDVKVEDNSVDEDLKHGFELSTDFSLSDNIHNNEWDYAQIDHNNPKFLS